MTRQQLIAIEMERSAADDQRRAERQPCFIGCRICGHCEQYSSQFPECRRCYPANESQRMILQQWEHCRCRQLPWEDFMGGRKRRNAVLRPTRDDAKARAAATGQIMAETARGQRINEYQDMMQVRTTTEVVR